ncbi:TPA: Stealth CR1 domain-containing protein [Streptococcus suis]|nr:Stealth CR1 domain-containing protein [Streptococcus suis]
MNDFPIDIVIPWVDGSDPSWRAERAKYDASATSDNDEARYRVWDTFQYWFRGIEKNAPWVRKIHFLTVGHVPEWLDVNHPKLNIVRHEEFIPKKYLPTFNSHTIELNMHRIPGLADHFIYFNDDVYLTQPTQKSDFFEGGLPKDTAVLGIVKNTDRSNYMPYIMLNMLALINEKFDKREVMKGHFSHWFSLKYGKNLLNNALISSWDCFTGFRNFHTCVPYLKSTLEEVWQTFPDVLDDTCSHKFRSKEDVNQYLFRYWQLVNNRFVPMKPNSAYITIGKQDVSVLENMLAQERYKVICVNDDPILFDFEQEELNIKRAFDTVYPEKSSFELV